MRPVDASLQLREVLDTLVRLMNEPLIDTSIILRKNEDHRVAAGHPWVFSNEIREIKGTPAIGDVVDVRSAGGLPLGIGFYNPHSLIAVRLVSRTPIVVDEAFFRDRFATALALRKQLMPREETFRLVHGEGDFLPGLIIDKFNEYFSVQTLSYGMDARLPFICDALDAMFHPAGIIERNESPLRTLERLEQKKGVLRGTVAPTIITEHGLRYTVDVLEGQKTGFFLDQRVNRVAVRAFAGGASVLDCFCNDGGFALNAARGGARTVTGIDASEDAIARARKNAELNSLPAIQFERADVFDKLDVLSSAGEKFDVVILDPPSFTKNRKTVPVAKKGYKDLHTKALRVLRKGGYLLSASCSHHIEPDVFLSLIDETARKNGRIIQLLDWRGASPDHPTLLAVPETRYLKFGVFRVS
jgi:23S rRNA (cytosine1962-C5)-methyltransferase